MLIAKTGGALITKKKKKAFTLIELLAIIVILAIIAVITVPIILNIIDNSRRGAASDSAYGYKDAVNKWYVSVLSEPGNSNLKLQGEYTVTDGVLNGTGASNIAIPLSGDKPSSGKLHYTNNLLDAGCLVIGGYKITFKEDGSIEQTIKGDCTDYEFRNTAIIHPVEPLEIGDSVSYSTTMNGVTLNSWKVFYIDGDYTYLILSNFLPSTAINSDNTSNISGISTDGDNGIVGGSASQFITAMTTTSNWSELVTNGKINNVSINQSVSDDVFAIGSPTIELWTNCWNYFYTDDKIYIKFDETDTEGIDGYYVGSSLATVTDQYSLANKSGVGNTLLFPDDTYYWLSSQSSSASVMISVGKYDGIGHNWSGLNDAFAIRPVIKLPTSVVNQ